MKNGYKLKWSIQSRNDLKNILDFISSNWSSNEVLRFAKKLNKRINLIAAYPELFPKTLQKENIHRSVLTKQITIYYSFEDDLIKIISLFDVRQNPKKLKIQ
jgi:plasmid stabilization system protein ParE